jgi:hypothetical protein
MAREYHQSILKLRQLIIRQLEARVIEVAGVLVQPERDFGLAA